jgi:hypothetical protein
MGKNCAGCVSKCGKPKGSVKSFSYLLKEVSTGDYLDIDTYDDSSLTPVYYLHGEPKYALRFATKHEALQALGKVLSTGLELPLYTLPIEGEFTYVQFKVVKRVKRSRV